MLKSVIIGLVVLFTTLPAGACDSHKPGPLSDFEDSLRFLKDQLTASREKYNAAFTAMPTDVYKALVETQVGQTTMETQLVNMVKDLVKVEFELDTVLDNLPKE